MHVKLVEQWVVYSIFLVNIYAVITAVNITLIISG